jgi:hypothetical protein
MKKISFLHKFLLAHCFVVAIIVLFFYRMLQGGEVEYAKYYVFLQALEMRYPAEKDAARNNMLFLPLNRKRNIFLYPAHDYRDYSALRIPISGEQERNAWVLLDGLDDSDSTVIMTTKAKLFISCEQVSKLALEIKIHRPTLSFLRSHCQTT